MKKIKVVGFFILLLSAVLILLLNFRSSKEQAFTEKIRLVNQQKSHTQEIAKMIFYTHRYKKEFPEAINMHMYSYLGALQSSSKEDKDSAITKLSQDFFELVNQFKYVYTGNVPYNIVILDKLVNNIYKKNMELVTVFSRYTASLEKRYTSEISSYTTFQYILFGLLMMLLVYIFSQVDEIIRFVQKFTKTSSRIIKKSTIKGLEPISLQSDNIDLELATHNFNTLVENIDLSINAAAIATGHTIQSLEIVESNIEHLITLIHQMQTEDADDIYEKEDTIIESLETLMGLATHLKSLKKALISLT